MASQVSPSGKSSSGKPRAAGRPVCVNFSKCQRVRDAGSSDTIPLVVSEPKQVTRQGNGEVLTLHEAIFHPTVLDRAVRDDEFRDALLVLALDCVEEKHSTPDAPLRLSRSFRFDSQPFQPTSPASGPAVDGETPAGKAPPRTPSDGTAPISDDMMRDTLTALLRGKAPVQDESPAQLGRDLVIPGLTPAAPTAGLGTSSARDSSDGGSSTPAASLLRPPLIEEVDVRPRGHVEPEHTLIASENALTLTVSLPDVRRLEELELDISESLVTLHTDRFALVVALPSRIDHEAARAKLSKTNQRLTLVMPLAT